MWEQNHTRPKYLWMRKSRLKETWSQRETTSIKRKSVRAAATFYTQISFWLFQSGFVLWWSHTADVSVPELKWGQMKPCWLYMQRVVPSPVNQSTWAALSLGCSSFVPETKVPRGNLFCWIICTRRELRLKQWNLKKKEMISLKRHLRCKAWRIELARIHFFVREYFELGFHDSWILWGKCY